MLSTPSRAAPTMSLTDERIDHAYSSAIAGLTEAAKARRLARRACILSCAAIVLALAIIAFGR